MAKQTINMGTAPTGAGGDTRRSAFAKCQANFDEIYATGLVERGSNAKGEYTKWPDGTLHTWGSQLVNASTLAGQSAIWSATVAENQPYPFVGLPVYDLTYSFMSGSNGTGDTLYSTTQAFAQAGGRPIILGVNMGTKPSVAFPSYVYGTINSLSYFVYFSCVGRWK